MEILSPIDTIKECKLLMKSGSKELFCGYIPQKWIKRYGTNKDLPACRDGGPVVNISPNKRGWIKANITLKEELNEFSSEIKANGGKLFITLNAFYYTSDAYDLLDEILNDLCDSDIYGVIVTDVALIKYISKNYHNLYIALSCCNQACNVEAVDFFVGLGVDRITFPRHISVKDMIDIVKQRPDTDFEVFVLDGRCIYDDGNCKAMHNFGNFCKEQWEYNYYKDGGKTSLSYDEMKNSYSAEEYFKHWTKCLSAWDVSTKGGWQSVSCGACFVPEFVKYKNIKAMKIAGRGMNTSTKLHLVRLVNRMLNIAQGENAVFEEMQLVKDTFGIPEYCDNHIRCITR